MIRRDVHGDHRFRSLAAVHGEFLRQKAQDEPPGHVLDQHDAFEPVLVVGRERHDQLLDRRVNRAEDRHAQQIAFRRLQQPFADHVGGERAHQQHEQRRRQDAQPRRVGDTQLRHPLEPRVVKGSDEAIDEPEDPDECRHADHERHRHEEPGDEAASKPLHGGSQPMRGNCSEDREPEHDSVPCEGPEPRPPDHGEKRLHHQQRRYERHHESDGDFERAFRRELVANLEQTVREGRSHRRHREKERKLRRRRAIEPHQHPAHDRGARSGNAGNHRQHLARADPERARERRAIRVEHGRHRAVTLDQQHDDAAGHKRGRKNLRALVEDGGHVISQQEACENGWQERHQNHQRKMTRVGIGRQTHHDVKDLRSIEPHHREDRSELDHDGEHASGILEVQEPRADEQMRRGRDGQKLSQPLNDAQQCGDE